MLRVAFLVGSNRGETRIPVEAVCAIKGVIPRLILLDTPQDSVRQQIKRLRRTIRRNGLAFIPYGVLCALRMLSDRLIANSVLDQDQQLELLRKAFPERHFTLNDIGKRYGVPVRPVSNLNSPEAIAALREAEVDLGIVLGTRILKPSTFTIPRLGSINLHLGTVPDFRGIPPGFWEIYHAARVAGVTVHFVNSAVDAGDVVDTGEIEVSPHDTPETLAEKLHSLGVRVLVRAVAGIMNGTIQRKPQTHTTIRPRTLPTRQEVTALRRRLPHWKRSPSHAIAQNLFHLAVFYSGLYGYRRRRQTRGTVVLMYQRGPDNGTPAATNVIESFAAQLLVLAKYYQPITLGEMWARMQRSESVPASTIVLHWDDRDPEWHNDALRILGALGIVTHAYANHTGELDATHPKTLQPHTNSSKVAARSISLLNEPIASRDTSPESRYVEQTNLQGGPVFVVSPIQRPLELILELEGLSTGPGVTSLKKT